MRRKYSWSGSQTHRSDSVLHRIPLDHFRDFPEWTSDRQNNTMTSDSPLYRNLGLIIMGGWKLISREQFQRVDVAAKRKCRGKAERILMPTATAIALSPTILALNCSSWQCIKQVGVYNLTGRSNFVWYKVNCPAQASVRDQTKHFHKWRKQKHHMFKSFPPLAPIHTHPSYITKRASILAR